jgi:hypothetical protein
MTSDEIKNPANQVHRAVNGKFYTRWRGQTVYTRSGTVKHFDTEGEARAYLADCDRAGKMLN